MSYDVDEKGNYTLVEKSWEERIKEAEERGGEFTGDDRWAVDSWTSCAVGEATAGMDLNQDDDPKIYWMGVDFASAVRRNDIEQAKILLVKIRERVKELTT